MHSLTDAWFYSLMDELATHGWAMRDDFLAPELIDRLAFECQTRYTQGFFAPAAIGHGAARQTYPKIRSDAIEWLELGLSAATDTYLHTQEQLRLALNQSLFLGVHCYESHFAYYAEGAYYSRHLDCFHDSDARVLSAIVYLNKDWQHSEGGALCLHLEAGKRAIAPEAGRLVLFESAKIWHEVLPATRTRMSLCGWFRRAPTLV